MRSLPTPCLVIDPDAVERNLREAARQADGLRIRPHFKAHKCVPLLRRQLAAPDHAGVSCATAAEALVLARAGIGDLLVANEVIDEVAAAELAEAAALVDVLVAVDSVQGLERASGRVLVDIDVGQGRCGLAPGDPQVVALARAAGDRFGGLMGYDGHAQHAGAAARAESSARVAAVLAAERDRLRAEGLAVPIVSGAGSGTLADAARAGVLTEAQPGSYVLGDGDYGRLGLGFAQAVWCVATVISRRGDTAVLNAGLKHLSAESGLPAVAGATVVGIADEHLTLRLRGQSPESQFALGATVRIVPSHLDPTLNLHDAAVCGDELWPIDGRASVRERWSRVSARRTGPGP